MTDGDRVARAYYRLKALRENLPQGTYVNEGWVTEYHDILTQHLVPAFDTQEFQIPDKWLIHLDEGGNPLQEELNYIARMKGHPAQQPDRKRSKERYVGRNTFLAKLDAILGYFEFVTQPQARDPRNQQIGFQGPRRNPE